MPEILNWNRISELLPDLDLTQLIKDGFIAYSQGDVVVPPVGEMQYENPPGDTHIKYGFIKGDDYFVIKVASGFYENTKLGISSSQGLMLIFSQKTGQIKAILLDDGGLTDIRTAVAGLCAAQHLAPKTIKGIGIIGTGIQARLQLEYLLKLFPADNIWVSGRTEEHVDQFVKHFAQQQVKVNVGAASEIGNQCNLIVTTTPALSPVISDADIMPGTHINAVGSDTKEKNEIDINLFKRLDVIVADSLSQCQTRGEIHQALKHGIIQNHQVIELGNVLSGELSGRVDDDQITIADLTGVAVQDIQIAKAIYLSHMNSSG